MTRIAKFVGLDVHKDTIAIAVSEGGPACEARDLGVIPHDVPKLVKRLLSLGTPENLFVVYEAGPTGFGLCRELGARGIQCIVVAPMRARGKGQNITIVAMARELLGFVWAIGQEVGKQAA